MIGGSSTLKIGDAVRTAYIRAQVATAKSLKIEAPRTKSGRRSTASDYQMNEDDINLLTGHKCPGLVATLQAQVNKEHCNRIFAQCGISDPGYAEYLSYHLARCILAPDISVRSSARNNEIKPLDEMAELFMKAQADPVATLHELELKPLKVLLWTLMVSSFKAGMSSDTLDKKSEGQSAFYPDRSTSTNAMATKCSRVLTIVSILLKSMHSKADAGSMEAYEQSYIALTLALDPTGGISNKTFDTLHARGVTPKAQDVNKLIRQLEHQLTLYWMWEKKYHDSRGYDDGSRIMTISTADNADCLNGILADMSNMIVGCAHTCHGNQNGKQNSNNKILEARRYSKEERDLLDAATKSRGTDVEGSASMPQPGDWKYMEMSQCEEDVYTLFKTRRLFHGLIFAAKDGPTRASHAPLFKTHDKVEVQLNGTNVVVEGVVEM